MFHSMWKRDSNDANARFDFHFFFLLFRWKWHVTCEIFNRNSHTRTHTHTYIQIFKSMEICDFEESKFNIRCEKLNWLWAGMKKLCGFWMLIYLTAFLYHQRHSTFIFSMSHLRQWYFPLIFLFAFPSQRFQVDTIRCSGWVRFFCYWTPLGVAANGVVTRASIRQQHSIQLLFSHTICPSSGRTVYFSLHIFLCCCCSALFATRKCVIQELSCAAIKPAWLLLVTYLSFFVFFFLFSILSKLTLRLPLNICWYLR